MGRGCMQTIAGDGNELEMPWGTDGDGDSMGRFETNATRSGWWGRTGWGGGMRGDEEGMEMMTNTLSRVQIQLSGTLRAPFYEEAIEISGIRENVARPHVTRHALRPQSSSNPLPG